jgi:PPOX class probable F420-dependent enzyme
MVQLTDAQVALMRAANFAAVATLKENGRPQTSIVWIDTDGEHAIFNTRIDRAKWHHLRRDPRVSVSVIDRQDPYRYIEIEGIAELELDGANDHINELSRKYRGIDFHTPEDRVIVKVTPQRVYGYNLD